LVLKRNVSDIPATDFKGKMDGKRKWQPVDLGLLVRKTVNDSKYKINKRSTSPSLITSPDPDTTLHAKSQLMLKKAKKQFKNIGEKIGIKLNLGKLGGQIDRKMAPEICKMLGDTGDVEKLFHRPTIPYEPESREPAELTIPEVNERPVERSPGPLTWIVEKLGEQSIDIPETESQPVSRKAVKKLKIKIPKSDSLPVMEKSQRTHHTGGYNSHQLLPKLPSSAT